MKKSILAFATIVVLSGTASAEEKIGASENSISFIGDESSFFIGGGLSNMELSNDLTDEAFSAKAVVLQMEYQYNRYIGVLGRYSFNIGSADYSHGITPNPDYTDYPTDFSNMAIYLKAIYPIANFSPYLLLGYGEVELTNAPHSESSGINVNLSESGFQWGLGIDYAFNDQISIFIDYVQMYDDKGFDGIATDADVTADMWTVGVSYRF
jgi:opacity protein-like surface antigen